MKRILGLMMTIAMLFTALPAAVYAEGTGKDDIDIAVDFVNDYLSCGENEYRVFGTNNTGSAQTVQTVRVLYNGDTPVSMDYGEQFTVAPGEEFAVKESVSIPEGTDLGNSYVNIFVWDDMNNYKPLAKQFGSMGLTFEFTVEEGGANTSAGVYTEDGTLIRMLWGAEWYDAGTYTAKWDGKNDVGEPVDNGNYVVKVLSNNVKYEQDALIANNTIREKADTMMSNFMPISDMTLLGSNMYYSEQYMENGKTLKYFNINDIHRTAGYFESRGNRGSIRNANDGEVVYWLIFDRVLYNKEKHDDITYDYEARCFVMGVDVSSNTQVVYEYGEPHWNFWGNGEGYFKSAIGYEPYESEGLNLYNLSAQTGYGDIAVQQEGNLLFVTYGSRDFVRVIDKTTGQTLMDNPIKEPTAIAVDGNDLLWVAYTDEEGNYAISQFTVASDGTMNLAQSMPQSLCQGPCLALAASPDNSYMTVAFGGGVGKIFAYNISDWSEKWSFGRGGDYSQDSTVYDDKFCFRCTSAGAEYTYLTFQDENYLWMGDPGNDRNYKLYVGGEGTPTIADTIAYPKQHYACEVDAADSTRIMFGPKEYKIDYSKEGDESWTLANNYIDLIAPYVRESTAGMFYGITTMSNGRVYFGGEMKEVETTDVYGGTIGNKYIYELTDSGARNTGVDITGWTVLEDGKMTLQKADDCNYNGISGRAVYQKKFKGFDEDGNPSWYDREMVAFISDALQKSWSNTIPSSVAISENGIVFPVNVTAGRTITYRTAENPRDFRIGGFKASTDENTDWLFHIGPATTVNYDRYVFPRDGHVEIHAVYGLSGQAKAYGDNMIIHYRGEGQFHGSQANIFYHYLDNGLLVGVFGVARNEQNTVDDYNQSLVSGNAFNWHMAYPPGGDGDTAYIYQGGEACMSGCLRTKVTGLNSIKITEIPITLGNTYRSGILVRSYNGTACSNTTEINNSVRYNFSLPEDVDGNGSAKYETYIKVPKGEEKELSLWAYSDGNVRIVYNNEDVISGTGVVGQQIALSSDRYKKLTIYVTPNDGQLSYFELKADFDGVRTDIPTKYLYAIPEQTYVGLTEYDLLEDLPLDSTLTGQTIAGWDFSGWNTGSNTVKTNVGYYDWETGSSLTLYGYLSYGENIWATRDLGNVRYDMDSWKISTLFTMEGSPNGYYTYSAPHISGEQCKYMDILDANGKIIARVTYEDDQTLKVNGETLINTDSTQSYLSYKYINELTVPSELEIYAYNGQLVFNYRNHSVTTGVYESGADWHSPKTLKVWAFKNCKYGAHRGTFSTDFITLNYTQYAMDEPCVVRFYDEDRTTLLGTSVVEKGDAANAPDAHKGGYILSWSSDITNVSGDMDVYAVYTKDENYYKVSFYDEDSNLLSVQEGQYGTTISYDAPEKSGYVFLYWMDENGNQVVDFTNRQKDLTVYPKYRKLINAEETFEDLDSRIIARIPYRYTDNSKTAIGAMTVSSSYLPAEGYGIESYTENADGTYSDVVLKTPMYSQLQGSTGFSDEYIYARANSNVSTIGAFGLLNMAGKDGNTSKVMLFNGWNTMLNYNKFRAYFDGVDSEDKVEVSFDFKVSSYNGNYSSTDASAGGFGDIIDTSYDTWSYPPTSMGVTGDGKIIKARCDAKYGYAVWDSENAAWVTLVSSSDSNATDWNSVKYILDMTNRTFMVYLNGTDKGTYAFANPASTVNAVEFNLMRNFNSSVYYIDNIKVRNNL